MNQLGNIHVHAPFEDKVLMSVFMNTINKEITEHGRPKSKM